MRNVKQFHGAADEEIQDEGCVCITSIPVGSNIQSFFNIPLLFSGLEKLHLPIPWIFQLVHDHKFVEFFFLFQFILHIWQNHSRLSAIKCSWHLEQWNVAAGVEPSWWQWDVKFHTFRIQGGTSVKSGFVCPK